MSIQLKGDNDDAILNNYKKVKDDLLKIGDDGVDVKLAGLQPLAAELTGTIGDDQRRAEVAAIPLVCVVLFFVFGGVDRGGPPGDHRRPDHRRRAGHHAARRRIHAGALLRPAGGDPDGPRHRGRLRPVHGEPVPRGDRRGLRHRGRCAADRDDLGPHDHVLRGDPGGVVGAAAAVPAGLPEVDHLRDHRLGDACGDPVDHRAGRRAGHPRPQRRRARACARCCGCRSSATGSRCGCT